MGAAKIYVAGRVASAIEAKSRQPNTFAMQVFGVVWDTIVCDFFHNGGRREECFTRYAMRDGNSHMTLSSSPPKYGELFVLTYSSTLNYSAIQDDQRVLSFIYS